MRVLPKMMRTIPVQREIVLSARGKGILTIVKRIEIPERRTAMSARMEEILSVVSFLTFAILSKAKKISAPRSASVRIIPCVMGTKCLIKEVINGWRFSGIIC